MGCLVNLLGNISFVLLSTKRWIMDFSQNLLKYALWWWQEKFNHIPTEMRDYCTVSINFEHRVTLRNPIYYQHLNSHLLLNDHHTSLWLSLERGSNGRIELGNPAQHLLPGSSPRHSKIVQAPSPTWRNLIPEALFRVHYTYHVFAQNNVLNLRE